VNDVGVGNVRIIFNLLFFLSWLVPFVPSSGALSKTSAPLHMCDPEKGRRKDLAYMFICLVV
jgi:hypothetical protein